MRLVSVFKRRIPKGTSIRNNVTTATIKIGDRTITFKNALKIQYSPEFSDIDESSKFYNKNFDKFSS
jgi:beta-xylosidase